MTGYERLATRDVMFLRLENENAPMQFGAVLTFDGPGFSRDDEELDIGRLRAHVLSRVHRIPNLRRRIHWPGAFAEPVWVDDDRFDVAYHVRHVALPQPRNDRALKTLASEILSQRLDPTRPLWELWAVERLDGERFALVCKVHHCLLDGAAGIAAIAGALLDLEPCDLPEPVQPWQAREHPGRTSLLLGEMRRRVGNTSGLLGGLRAVGGRVAGDTRQFFDNLGAALSDLAFSASDTPLNAPVGPARLVEWLSVDLDEVSRIRQVLGGTLNDVVIATVAGAVREHLRGRHQDVTQLDFRALVPVDPGGPDSGGGNRVTALVARLPVSIADPRRRLHEARHTMQKQKTTDQVDTYEVANWLADQTHSAFGGWLGRTMMRRRFYNMMITNVPGPPLPLYLLGAPMISALPAAQLYCHQALSVAVLSYNGRLYWGFTADRELVPDLDDFAGYVLNSFRDLQKACDG